MSFFRQKTRKGSENEELGAALEEMRRRLDLNQVEFGKLTGCQQSEISYYETGRELPSIKRLVRFLRLAAQDSERLPILAALERHGFLISDLLSALLGTAPAKQETAVSNVND
jgi:transcriptional regulator with XRE-family HTH domain